MEVCPYSYFSSCGYFQGLWQGSTNCTHGDNKVSACTKLHAGKSIKIPLSSTPMLFDVSVSYCV